MKIYRSKIVVEYVITVETLANSAADAKDAIQANQCRQTGEATHLDTRIISLKRVGDDDDDDDE